MISLKKHIEAQPHPLGTATLDAYRSLLQLLGRCGLQVCPQASEPFSRQLESLSACLTGSPEPAAVAGASKAAEAAVREWSDCTSTYYKQKTAEVKDLMLVLARAAESVGERDQRYTTQFHCLGDRLRQVADLDDLSKLRGSVLQSVIDLKAGVDQMTRENAAAVQKLQAEIDTYRERLEQTERIATTDPLTRLVNRRKLEAELDERTEAGKPFFVITLDLNNLKSVNDNLGHSAGDDLLRQFAQELKQALPPTDIVGRLSGDEFLVIACGAAAEGADRMARIERWVFGDYTLESERGRQKVVVSAGMGMCAWRTGMNPKELLHAADQAMYADKSRRKGGKGFKL
ncbi:MAG: GGDEF domain-containing protein [Bryobacterales bacterium]|nr:GGDEF domain-containing protein [Bryobacterales bacterium]